MPISHTSPRAPAPGVTRIATPNSTERTAAGDQQQLVIDLLAQPDGAPTSIAAGKDGDVRGVYYPDRIGRSKGPPGEPAGLRTRAKVSRRFGPLGR